MGFTGSPEVRWTGRPEKTVVQSQPTPTLNGIICELKCAGRLYEKSHEEHGMADQNAKSNSKNRRKLLTAIGASTVVGSAQLPGSWRKPAVASVMLPAHAQASGPCTLSGCPPELLEEDPFRKYTIEVYTGQFQGTGFSGNLTFTNGSFTGSGTYQKYRTESNRFNPACPAGKYYSVTGEVTVTDRSASLNYDVVFGFVGGGQWFTATGDANGKYSGTGEDGGTLIYSGLFEGMTGVCKYNLRGLPEEPI